MSTHSPVDGYLLIGLQLGAIMSKLLSVNFSAWEYT